MVPFFFFPWNASFINSFHRLGDKLFPQLPPSSSESVCLENIFMSASTIDKEALNNNMLILHRLAVRRSTSSSEAESRTRHLPSAVHHLYLRIFVLALTHAMWCWPQRNKPPSTSRWNSKQQIHPTEFCLRSSVSVGCCMSLLKPCRSGSAGRWLKQTFCMQQSAVCRNAAPYVVTGDKRRAVRGLWF